MALWETRFFNLEEWSDRFFETTCEALCHKTPVGKSVKEGGNFGVSAGYFESMDLRLASHTFVQNTDHTELKSYNHPA